MKSDAMCVFCRKARETCRSEVRGCCQNCLHGEKHLF